MIRMALWLTGVTDEEQSETQTQKVADMGSPENQKGPGKALLRAVLARGIPPSWPSAPASICPFGWVLLAPCAPGAKAITRLRIGAQA